MSITTEDFEYELAPSQPSYTYFVTDLRNNDIVGELDLQNVSYSRILSGIGEFNGSISINRDTLAFLSPQSGGDGLISPLLDRSFPTNDIRSVTTPGRFGLYAYRDGQPVWGGILWKRQYNSANGTGVMALSAKTFESYFYHRFQHVTKYWSNNDQLDIARWLVENNNTAKDLLIDVDQIKSNKMRERTMFGYEYKSIGEELEQLAALIDGFDWNVEIGVDENGSPTRTLRFYYPRAGVSREKTTLQFAYPGVIKSYVMTDDSETGGNFIWTIGAGEGTEMIVQSAADYGQLENGWPMLEASRSYKSVVRPSTLLEHANQALEKLNTPISIFEVDLRGDLNPLFGTYRLGDWARFRFKDYYFYTPETVVSTQPETANSRIYDAPVHEQMARITGYTVTIDNTSGVESITLELGGDELAGEE